MTADEKGLPENVQSGAQSPVVAKTTSDNFAIDASVLR
jgi:hypothetical protein